MGDRNKGITPSGVATRKGKKGIRRPTTVAAGRLSREEIREAESILDALDSIRPRTRRDCVNAARPCPWVSCKFHLYLDVNPETGSIKVNFPDREVWEMEETCALDVADRGGITLEEVGEFLNLTRERIRQVEAQGLGKLHLEYVDLGEGGDDP